jgi:hypothetical protein
LISLFVSKIVDRCFVWVFTCLILQFSHRNRDQTRETASPPMNRVSATANLLEFSSGVQLIRPRLWKDANSACRTLLGPTKPFLTS